jgi:hypothetical protein
VTETPPRPAVLGQIDEIATVLATPLDDAERADGWTERSQSAVLAGLSRLKIELESGRFGDEADYTSHHLVRVVDHWGVSQGHLLERLAELRTALIAMRP